MTRIKICGITNRDDAMAAVEAGADALGFVFYAKSPRAISSKAAEAIIAECPPFVTSVGVFVDEDLEMVRKIMNECGLRAAQLHGDETADYCNALGCSVIKAIRVHDGTDFNTMGAYQVAAFLLDTYVSGMPGGTGVSIDLELAGKAKRLRPIILAGGLTPENVGEAIRRLRPYGVDVSSGVEISPGKKDHVKLRAFITAAKAAIPS